MLDRATSGPVIKGHYIGGQWVQGTGTFVDSNPSDGSTWATVPDAGIAEVRAAIDAGQAAFEGWSSLKFSERAHYLLKMADIWERRIPDFVTAMQGEGGGWFGKGMFEAGYVPEVFRAAAAACFNPIGEVMPSETGKFSTAVRSPMGVVTIISPWNFPGILSSRGLAFPLAAGNTIVLKPSEDTPYCGGLFFAEVAEEAGLPAGVFNVVVCSRDNVQVVGDELIENPLVKGVSFTGSTPVGRTIAAKCGAHLKKCCVELGGKDSLIVRADADLERATQAANFGSFMHQGQICMSVEKVLVHESIYPEFLRRFAERARKLPVGNTSDKGNVIGPLINDRQVARVKSQIEDALARGAKVVVGGGIKDRFVEPTILTGVTPDMKVYQDETFGPVVPVIPFSTDEEAIAIANDTEYGLSSGIITADEERALEMARSLQTGMCHINCSSVNDEPHVPFGGSKASGVGRHGGRWSMETFTETRWITMDRGGRPYPPVF
ncbi:aldehyde dehydrogenase family protein [Actibacterium pelagium]|uniref:Aldehyde dehydrogenase n=1 Tax=Actibacterium pelagium TaxID=2029103 RepID=A0A917ADV0_9RHOB|nr:aldehyde dehydrogenase family protein [Actibacterium pelagium]GGE43093.1 aldehyde dehydrogenase [Actibacterium pelagium]